MCSGLYPLSFLLRGSAQTVLQKKTPRLPELRGPCLGQEPPDMIREIFAAGILSTGFREIKLEWLLSLASSSKKRDCNLSAFPSNHHEEAQIMTKKDVKDSLGALVISAKPLMSSKAPEIGRNSPFGRSRDYEKYSGDDWAAIRISIPYSSAIRRKTGVLICMARSST